MLLFSNRVALSLFPFFLGWISFVAASPSNSDAVADPSYGNRCVEPQIRREWRTLSVDEKTEWVNAVKCLTKVPHRDYIVPYPNHVNYTLDPPLERNTSMFDDFSFLHADLNPLIHFTGWFLPWHRSFVHRFERALRGECGFTGTQPYWDWTKDAGDFYNSSIFDPDPRTGLGGWGDPSDDFQITTGAFASDFVRPYPAPHRIRRNYTVIPAGGGFGDGTPPITQPLNTFFTLERVDTMVGGSPGDFLGFQKVFEAGDGPHGAVHQIVGGDLFGLCPSNAAPSCARGPKWTPNDPLFFLHHAMVDKLWDDWQRRRPENFWSFHGGTVGAHSAPGIYDQFPNGAPPFLNLGSELPGDSFLNNATVYTLMDIRAYDFCYTYE